MRNPFRRRKPTLEPVLGTAEGPGKKRSALTMALLCAHCSLTLFGAIAALAFAAIPAGIALRLRSTLPFLLVLGLVALFMARPKLIFGPRPATCDAQVSTEAESKEVRR